MYFGHFIDYPSNFVTSRLPTFLQYVRDIFLASDNFQLTDTMCLLIVLSFPKNVTTEIQL